MDNPNKRPANNKVGVVIGRFQANKLTEAHRYLIDTANGNHKKLIVVIGTTAFKGLKNNPLDFEARKMMVMESYPNAIILENPNCKEDIDWAKNVNKLIADAAPGESAVLYGGRDSCLPNYKKSGAGIHEIFEIHQPSIISNVSATAVRAELSSAALPGEAFRSGAIWHAGQSYPRTWNTVDIAPYDPIAGIVLMGRKINDPGLRFIGGFMDPKSDSSEQDAVRELKEETGMEVPKHLLKYICSIKINDWRLRKEEDSIRTNFYAVEVNMGAHSLKADDDIASIEWVEISSFPELQACNGFAIEHLELVNKFTEWYYNNHGP